MMKHSKISTKTLISGTFSFLLTILFFLLFVCVGLSFSVFNNSSIRNNINGTNYYNKVYTELTKKSEEIVTQVGLPTSVLQGVITTERVFVGGNNYISAALKNEDLQINTDKLQSDLQKQIDGYLTEQGMEQTKQIKSTKDQVVDRIVKEYQGGVTLPFITYYMKYRGEFNRAMTYLLPIQIILAGILCFLLIRIHKHRHRGLRYINYALLASSLLLLGISAFLLISREYTKLNVMPIYYKDFLTAYLKSDIKVFLLIGGIGLILAIALISLTKFIKSHLSNR